MLDALSGVMFIACCYCNFTVSSKWLSNISLSVNIFVCCLFFRLDHEYVIQGHFFHKGRMKVTVSKIFRVCI